MTYTPLRIALAVSLVALLFAALPASAEKKERPMTIAKALEKEYKYKFTPMLEPFYCSYVSHVTYIALTNYTVFGTSVSFDRIDENTLRVKVGEAEHQDVTKTGTVINIPFEGATRPITIYRHPVTKDWGYFCGDYLETKMENGIVRFFDMNCDGKWFEPKKDGIMYNEEHFITPLIENQWYFDWRLTKFEFVGEGKKQALAVSLDPIKCYPEERRAMDILNLFRMQMGLPALPLNEELSTKCRKYAQFISLQGGDMADWDIVMNPKPNHNGYTPECDEMKASMFFCFDGAVTALDDMIGQFYHRTQFFFPDTTGFGIGADGAVTVFNGEKMRDPEYIKWNYPILVPAPEQTIRYYEYYGKYGGETPDPRPAGAGGSFPITIQWGSMPEKLTVSSYKLYMVEGKKEVEVPSHCFWPGRPAHPSRPDNEGQILMMADKPFKRGVRYHVIINCTINEKPEKFDWYFETAKK